jgi:hypothetical protein
VEQRLVAALAQLVHHGVSHAGPLVCRYGDPHDFNQ